MPKNKASQQKPFVQAWKKLKRGRFWRTLSKTMRL